MGLPRVVPIAVTACGPDRPDVPAAVDCVVLSAAVCYGAFCANRAGLAEKNLLGSSF